MSSKIDLKNANCTSLSFSAPVQLKKEKDNLSGFTIEAYTGVAVERWWGTLAIDIGGISAKQKIPIFLRHDDSQIVGHSINTFVNGSFFVSGNFSKKTKAAKEVQELAEEDFPWQASIGVRPLKIMSLEKGAEGLVNGNTLTGPAEIWLESEVFEASFVPLGADSNTTIATFSKFEEAQPSAKPESHKQKEKFMDYTIEVLTKDAPELLAEIKATAKAEGVEEGIANAAEQMERVLGFASEIFGETGEKFKTVVESGVTLKQYQALKALQPDPENREDLKAQILAELEADSAGDPGSGEEAKGPKTFMEAWKAIKEEDKCSTQLAMSKASKDFPELYKKHSEGGK